MSWAVRDAIAACAPPSYVGRMPNGPPTFRPPKFVTLMEPILVQMNKSIAFVTLVSSYLRYVCACVRTCAYVYAYLCACV